jgi:hypothetical protein
MLTLEQNGNKERPNFVKLVVEQQNNGKWGIRFGGSAKVKLQGEYFL